MPVESWAKLNLPESMRRRIKSNAAISGLTMVQYIAGLVKKDEQARGSVAKLHHGTTPVKEVREC